MANIEILALRDVQYLSQLNRFENSDFLRKQGTYSIILAEMRNILDFFRPWKLIIIKIRHFYEKVISLNFLFLELKFCE